MKTDAVPRRDPACRDVRRRLQELHDDSPGRSAVPAALAVHLETCGSCRGFHRFLDGLPADLAAALDRPASPVSFLPAVQARPGWMRATVLAPALAAALAVAVGLPIGLAARERAATSAEVGAFVRDLYASAPLEGVEVAAAGSPAGILDGLGTDPWLVPGDAEQ